MRVTFAAMSARRQSTCRVAVVCLFQLPVSLSTNNVAVGKWSTEQGSAERKSGRVSHAMTAESIVLQNRVSMAHAVAQQRATTKTTITITNTAQRQLIIIRQRFGVSNLNSRAISSHGTSGAHHTHMPAQAFERDGQVE